jgi:AraC-like DNA-binding protein
MRGRARLGYLDTFDELSRWLRSAIEQVDIVVVPPRDAQGQDAARVVCEIVSARPRLAIVAYCQAGSQFSTDIRALATAGVHQFVFAGIDDSGVAFRAVLEAASRQCAAEWVMAQLAPVVPSALHPMMEVALSRPDQIVNLSSMADALGVHRKTLFNRCERAGFLAPAEVLLWVRLALVAYLLESTGCSVKTIALDLSFPSHTALRNAIKRYLGIRATELRSCGGVQHVVDALRQRLVRGRAADVGLHSL